VAFYDVELSAAEVAMLAGSANPHSVQPGNLKIYWPLWGTGTPAADLSGNATNGTENATSVVDHSPTGPYVRP